MTGLRTSHRRPLKQTLKGNNSYTMTTTMPPQVEISSPLHPSPPASDTGTSIDEDNVSATSSMNDSATNQTNRPVLSATNSPMKRSVRLSGKFSSVAAALVDPVQKMSMGGARAVSHVAGAASETVKSGAKTMSNMGKSGAKAVTHVGIGGARAMSNVALATSGTMQKMGKSGVKTVSNVASHGAKTVTNVATSIAKPVQNMGNHILNRKHIPQQQQDHGEQEYDKGEKSALRRPHHHRERKNSEDSSNDRRSRRSSRSSISIEEEDKDTRSEELEASVQRRKKKTHRSRGRVKVEIEANMNADVSENSHRAKDQHLQQHLHLQRQQEEAPKKENDQDEPTVVEGKVQETDEHCRMNRRSSWYNPTAPWETEEAEIEALQHLRTLPTRTKSCDAVMEHGMMMPGKLMIVERKKKKRLAATARHSAGHEDESDDDEEEDDRRRGCLVMSSLPSHSLSHMLSSNFAGTDGKGNTNDDDDDDEHSVSSWCNIDTSDSEWEENEDGDVQQNTATPVPTGGLPPKSRPRSTRTVVSTSLLSNAGLLDDVNHDDSSEAEDSEEDLLFSAS